MIGSNVCKSAIIAALALASITQADAATFAGTAVGSWLNPSATGAVYTISNNDDAPGASSVASFDFGTPNTTSDDSNLFTFNGVGSGGTTGFSTSSETPFSVGRFTYRNGTTSPASYPSGDSSVQLGISLNISSPSAVSANFTYAFNIDITPNTTGDPTLDADTVSISNGSTATTFTSGGNVFTLALLGFSQDGGNTFTNTFVAPEQTSTSAQVYATITANVTTVPEPASLVCLGAGLLAVGGVRRYRRPGPTAAQ